MNVKTLKKQLMAAIAMALVAAVALASSTFAWFVSNNSVEATTTSIYAQSNSAYLLIANNGELGAGNENKQHTEVYGGTTATSELTDSVALYPATWTNDVAVKVGDSTNDSNNWLFATGYASSPDTSNINEDGLFAIVADGEAIGSEAAAVASKYAYLNTFYVGTGVYDGSFTNLKVSDMRITVTGNNQLQNALRVLVKCENEWVVGKVAYTDANNQNFSIENGSHQTENKPDGIIREIAFGKSATGEDVRVDVYIYYEGSEAQVYSNNLSNINTDGVKAAVSFEATPAEMGK